MEENWNLDIDSYPKRLVTCDGVTLADTRFGRADR